MILLGIDSIFFLIELVIGYAVHSLALVADSFHMLNDVLSLLVGLWAVKVAQEKTSSKMYTYGVGTIQNCAVISVLTVALVAKSRNSWCARQRCLSRRTVPLHLP